MSEQSCDEGLDEELDLDSAMLTVFNGVSIEHFDSWSRLETALQNRAYPTVYALLRKQKEPFTPDEAVQLCVSALHNRLTLRAFQAILDHSAPLRSLLNSYIECGSGYSLVERVVSYDRADILDLLLLRGGNVNRRRRGVDSPLEAALMSQSLHCVDRLLQEPELDVTLTPQLLQCWSHAGAGGDLMDFCLQAAAPRVLGKEPSFHDPVPIPDQLTVVHAVTAENWNLVRRLCSERGTIPAKEGRRALQEFPSSMMRLNPDVGEIMDRAAALDAILSARPTLLRGRRACQLLVYYSIWEEGTVLVLEPWLKRIRKRKVPLRDFPGARGQQDFFTTLRLWLEKLPDGPVPAVDRHICVHEFLVESTTPEELELVFRNCAMLERPLDPRGILSNLSLSLLLYGTPVQVEEQLQPGGLLAGETPQALMKFCGDESFPRQKRAVLLAYMKKEENYEL